MVYASPVAETDHFAGAGKKYSLVTAGSRNLANRSTGLAHAHALFRAPDACATPEAARDGLPRAAAGVLLIYLVFELDFLDCSHREVLTTKIIRITVAQNHSEGTWKSSVIGTNLSASRTKFCP